MAVDPDDPRAMLGWLNAQLDQARAAAPADSSSCWICGHAHPEDLVVGADGKAKCNDDFCFGEHPG